MRANTLGWSLLKRAPRRSATAGQALYASAVDQARRPAFYTGLGVPDSANGRFELYSLHVILLLRRLKGGGAEEGETAQVLFDTFVSSLDDALREQGVGDLSVAKKMRKLGEAFYGRVKSYDEAMDQLPDEAELEGLIGRTVCAEGGDARRLADYAAQALTGLMAQTGTELLDGQARWPEIDR